MKPQVHQTSLFPSGERQFDNCCSCRYFAELKEPWERSGGGTIFGYCFKYGDKDHSPNMGKGFPVFIIGEGNCKNFKKRKDHGEQEKQKSEPPPPAGKSS